MNTKVTPKQYQEALSKVPELEHELIRRKKLIETYLNQQADNQYKDHQLKAKEKVDQFRTEFNKMAEAAILSKCEDLNNFVNNGHASAEQLTRWLTFRFTGPEIFQFLYNCGLTMNIRTNLNRQSAFPILSIKDYEQSVRQFINDFNKDLFEILHKQHGGEVKFCEGSRFTKGQFNEAYRFKFKSEKDLFKLLYFTGCTLAVTYKYKQAEFGGLHKL